MCVRVLVCMCVNKWKGFRQILIKTTIKDNNFKIFTYKYKSSELISGNRLI